MELNVGTNIKRLRLAKGLTQEQLAELLMISTAAVSKWEAKNTYPDITMLFPLAQIFEISVDELLGYDEAKEKADIDKILEDYRRLFVEGKYIECSELIESARKKYPHDYSIMIKYMWYKAGGNAGNNTKALLENKGELTQICDCVLEGCTQDDLRMEAINMKAKLRHISGNTEEALEILSRLPYVQAQLLKEQLFGKDTQEFRYWNKKNCYAMMDSMSIKLVRIIRFDPSLTSHEKKNRIEHIADIFCQISEKENLDFFCIGEQAIYYLLSDMLTADNAAVEEIIRVREKQFASMRKMMDLAETDKVLRELIETTYKTNDLIGWILKRLLNSPNPQLAQLRENADYMEMIKKWEK